MMKRNTLIYMIVTALLFVSFVSSAGDVFSSTADDLKNQIDSVGSKQENIQNQLNNVNNALSDKQKEYEQYSKEYAQLAKEYEQETSSLQKQIDELSHIFTEIESLQHAIETQESAYKQALDLFYRRAMVTYRYTQYSAIQMYVESGNLFDYNARIRLMKDMLESDQAQMEALRIMKQDLDAKKSLVEVSSIDITQAIQEKEKLIEKLKNNQQILEEDLLVSRDAIARLEAQEAALEAESRRLEAEIRELQYQYEKLLGQDDGQLHFLWPAPTGKYITSYYGYRTHPISGKWAMHSGIDIGGAAEGANIVAAEDGVVVTAAWNEGGYGWYVIVYHGDGISTLYAHSSKLLVKEGDQVHRGQVIALIGNTGASKGAHLHFEVRVNGATRNPLDYLDV